VPALIGVILEKEFLPMFIAFLLSGLVLATNPIPLADTRTAAKAPTERARLNEFITNSAAKVACSVTIEQFRPSDARWDVPGLIDREADVPRKPHLQSADDLAALLRRLLPECDIEVTLTQPPVIHVIDKRLRKYRDYCLDQRASVTFKGPLESLPNGVGKAFERRVRATPWTYGLVGDWSTDVERSWKNHPVRRILTDPVPLDKYPPIIWEAETRDFDGWLVTTVRYSGLMP
jgi:hypothetical protein